MSGSAPERLVCVAVVTAPHGVRGAFRLKTFTEVPGNVAAYGPLLDEQGRELFEVRVLGPAREGVVVATAAIRDRDAAEALRGLRLHVPRARLPRLAEEEFYHEDLIGLAAVGEAGEAVGRVAAVHSYGAGDALEIVGPDGRSLVLPFTRETVPVVDVGGGKILIRRPVEVVAGPEGGA